LLNWRIWTEMGGHVPPNVLGYQLTLFRQRGADYELCYYWPPHPFGWCGVAAQYLVFRISNDNIIPISKGLKFKIRNYYKKGRLTYTKFYLLKSIYTTTNYRIYRDHLDKKRTSCFVFCIGLHKMIYLELVYLVTALVPSETACLANSPGRRSL
jgi:hypothetical protein